MSKKPKDIEIIFFAYQGKRDGQCDENIDAIEKGAEKINHYLKKSHKAVLWKTTR